MPLFLMKLCYLHHIFRLIFCCLVSDSKSSNKNDRTGYIDCKKMDFEGAIVYTNAD